MTRHAPYARYDMYRLIHKAMRAFMAETLTALGAMDPADDGEVAETLERVEGLLAFCRSHLEHENAFVHPAMEARAPGSAGGAAADHVHHGDDLKTLAADLAAVRGTHGDARAAAAHALYRHLAEFVGDNLGHMEVEESHHNGVLWQFYRDDELMAIEGAIIASQPPEEAMLTLRWMLVGANAAERAALLAAVRATVPPEVFGAILSLAQAHLRPADFAKLSRALDARPLAA